MAERTLSSAAARSKHETRRIPCAHERDLLYRGVPLVMGILNATPDSFSDGGVFHTQDEAIAHAKRMQTEGADLIDVGGESTRPGSKPVPLEEELRRIIPLVSRLAKSLAIPLSVDTSKAEVARQALMAGACLVNDITALRQDPHMREVVLKSRAALILMHMQGNPRTMQQRPRYHDVARDVRSWLRNAALRAEAFGIDRARILLDPGLGFGKTVRHNLQLMHALKELVSLGYPVVLGPSRKSFIGKVLDVEIPERLFGTLGCVGWAFAQKVQMVRVHDVGPAVQVLRMLHALETSS